MHHHCMVKFLPVLVLLLFVIPIVSADTLGIFKQGECVSLIQTCSDCTFINISNVFSPNSTPLLGEVSMTQTGTFYNYTFCDTTQLGSYIVNGYGDLGGENEVWSYSFDVTNSGRNFNLGDTLTYSFFLIICLVVVFLSSKLILKNSITKDPLMNSKLYETKKRNEFLYYVSVLKSKLWIVGLFGIYLSTLLFVSLFNQLVYNLGFMDLNTILQNVVLIMSWGLIPFGLFWIGYLIITVYKTTERVMRHQFGGIKE